MSDKLGEGSSLEADKNDLQFSIEDTNKILSYVKSNSKGLEEQARIKFGFEKVYGNDYLNNASNSLNSLFKNKEIDLNSLLFFLKTKRNDAKVDPIEEKIKSKIGKFFELNKIDPDKMWVFYKKTEMLSKDLKQYMELPAFKDIKDKFKDISNSLALKYKLKVKAGGLEWQSHLTCPDNSSTGALFGADNKVADLDLYDTFVFSHLYKAYPEEVKAAFGGTMPSILYAVGSTSSILFGLSLGFEVTSGLDKPKPEIKTEKTNSDNNIVKVENKVETKDNVVKIEDKEKVSVKNKEAIISTKKEPSTKPKETENISNNNEKIKQKEKLESQKVSVPVMADDKLKGFFDAMDKTEIELESVKQQLPLEYQMSREIRRQEISFAQEKINTKKSADMSMDGKTEIKNTLNFDKHESVEIDFSKAMDSGTVLAVSKISSSSDKKVIEIFEKLGSDKKQNIENKTANMQTKENNEATNSGKDLLLEMFNGPGRDIMINGFFDNIRNKLGTYSNMLDLNPENLNQYGKLTTKLELSSGRSGSFSVLPNGRVVMSNLFENDGKNFFSGKNEIAKMEGFGDFLGLLDENLIKEIDEEIGESSTYSKDFEAVFIEKFTKKIIDGSEKLDTEKSKYNNVANNLQNGFDKAVGGSKMIDFFPNQNMKLYAKNLSSFVVDKEKMPMEYRYFQILKNTNDLSRVSDIFIDLKKISFDLKSKGIKNPYLDCIDFGQENTKLDQNKYMHFVSIFLKGKKDDKINPEKIDLEALQSFLNSLKQDVSGDYSDKMQKQRLNNMKLNNSEIYKNTLKFDGFYKRISKKNKPVENPDDFLDRELAGV